MLPLSCEGLSASDSYLHWCDDVHMRVKLLITQLFSRSLNSHRVNRVVTQVEHTVPFGTSFKDRNHFKNAYILFCLYVFFLKKYHPIIDCISIEASHVNFSQYITC